MSGPEGPAPKEVGRQGAEVGKWEKGGEGEGERERREVERGKRCGEKGGERRADGGGERSYRSSGNSPPGTHHFLDDGLRLGGLQLLLHLLFH